MTVPLVSTLMDWLILMVGLVGMNMIPLFMPPTWAVLSWLHVQEGLPVWGLAASGAIGSTLGRGVLAAISRKVGSRILPRRWRANIEAVIALILSRRALRFSWLSLFAWGPVSSNYLFIAAGISGMPLLPPMLVYVVARFISYLVVVSVTKTTFDSFNDLFDPGMDRGWLPALQLVGILILIILMRQDWTHALGRLMPSPDPQDADTERKDPGPD